MLLLAVVAWSEAPGQTPVPGQNINMVSGITLPGGDPYLQRQSEPSLAISTRNPQHLLGGANDYRTVNLNSDTLPGQSFAADAWLGVFRSVDGGATWTSTVLPGWPGDQTTVGQSSPLYGFTTASDPTVRSAPAGLFYYSGIAFNRGTNLGVVFVSRFMDLNNTETGNPVRYVSTIAVDSGTSGQFLDKPWIAVGLPTGGTCTLQVPSADGSTVTQTVPAAPVYLLWSRFTGATSTKIMFSRSLDCGATWSTPSKLSESNSINQGTSIAVGPTGANIYVAWRRFATSSQPGAIVAAVSTTAGKSFSKAVDVVDLQPYNPAVPNGPSFFDQAPTPGSNSQTFRTNAFPSIAVDGGGVVYVAWSQRGWATGGQARITMSTSSDGVNWSAPFPVDNGPLNDRGLNVVDSSNQTLTQGHQFMPQLDFSGGQLTLAYYDHRQDHTVAIYTPYNPFAADAYGRFYNEMHNYKGELPGSPGSVFTAFLTDDGLTLRRHTIDVVVAQAQPSATPTFVTARVSQYKFGLRNDGTDVPGSLQQLQFNPPNLPMFAQGTVPFIGDYIDVAGNDFQPPATSGGSWKYNLSEKSPVQFVTWTDNRDVLPPSDGDWTKFTPPGLPGCDPGHFGDRNQNIYVSRITQGLRVSSPQNSKPLSTSLQRMFIVLVQNFTNFSKTFRLTIANQPAGGWASFLPGTNNSGAPPTPPAPSPNNTLLDITVPAHSGVARGVFATSTNPVASITVNAQEIAALGASVLPSGLQGYTVLNPDPSAPPLTGATTLEAYDPGITDPTFDATVPAVGINGSLTNNNLPNGSLTNTELSNGSLTNGSLTNGSLTNGSLTNGSLTNGSLTNLDPTAGSLTNGSLTNGSLTNGSLTNGSLTNSTISDATYTVTNNGDTTSSYTVKLAGDTSTATGNLQLIASVTYYTPFGLDCSGPKQQPQSIILSNVITPLVQTLTNSTLTNSDLTNGSPANMTIAVPPGGNFQLTIRGLGLTVDQLKQTTQNIVPVIVAQGSNTDGNTPKFAAPLFISTVASALPGGTVNVVYPATTLQFIGGTGAVTWSVPTGSLPAGLTLDANTGTISGTPAAAGTFNFTLQVTDSSNPPNTAQRSGTITIAQANTTTTITAVSPNKSLVGQTITVSWSVTPAPPAGSSPATPSGTVTISDGTNSCTGPAPSGSCSLTPAASAPGTITVSATYGGDSNFLGSAGSTSHALITYNFTGFLSPLNPAGTISAPTYSGTGKLGNAQPLKWQLTDDQGNFISDLSTTISISAIYSGPSCPAAVGPGAGDLLYSPTTGAKGGSTFRYDSSGNQFIFNWDTGTESATGPGCYAVVLQLNDKSPAKVTEILLQ